MASLPRRPLNAKEQSYLFEEHFTNFALATTVSLSSSLVQPTIATAIKKQQNLHPILRSRIVNGDDGASFALEELPTPPAIAPKIVRVSEKGGDLNAILQHVTQNELNLPIPVETGPLARVTLLVPESEGSNRYGLVMCFAHAVCDGKLGFEILKDILVELLGGSTEEPGVETLVTLSPSPVGLIPPQTSTLMLVLELANLFGWLLTRKVSMLPNRSSEGAGEEDGTLLHIVNLDQQRMHSVAARARAKGGTVTSLLVYALARAIGQQLDETPYNLLGAVAMDNRPLLDLTPKFDGAFNSTLLVPFSSTTTSVSSITHHMRRLLTRNMNFHMYKFLASKKVVPPPSPPMSPPAPAKPPTVPVSFAVSNLGNHVIPEIGKDVLGPLALSSTQHPSRGGFVEVTAITVNGIMSVAVMGDASCVSRRMMVEIGEHLLTDLY